MDGLPIWSTTMYNPLYWSKPMYDVKDAIGINLTDLTLSEALDHMARLGTAGYNPTIRDQWRGEERDGLDMLVFEEYLDYCEKTNVYSVPTTEGDY